jgi:hypothetical protein
MRRVDIANGDPADLDAAHAEGGWVVTCPDRSGDCPYAHGPDPLSMFSAASWRSAPWCPGRSHGRAPLVAVPAGEYDGPRRDFPVTFDGGRPR